MYLTCRLANLFKLSGLSPDNAWNWIRKIKIESSLDSDYCNDLESQVQSFEYQLKVEPSRVRFENMTEKDLKTAAEMFLFMKICPTDPLKPWFVFYKHLFETQSLEQILLTLNRMMKGIRTPQNKYFLWLAQKLFQKTKTLISQQSNNITDTPVTDFANHPVHIIKDTLVFPSAFIPFCDFGENMSAMGVKLIQFSVKVCNSFQEIMHNDQLCYEVDLNKFSNKYNIERQLKSGFTFIMDYNEDRQITYEEGFKTSEYDSLVHEIGKSDEDQHAFIYLDTIGKKTLTILKVEHQIFLEPVKLIGEGEYNMNTMKEIKVTDSYLGLDQDLKKCQNEEPYFNCTTRHYHDAVLKQCGCLPLHIARSNKVIFLSNAIS